MSGHPPTVFYIMRQRLWKAFLVTYYRFKAHLSCPFWHVVLDHTEVTGAPPNPLPFHQNISLRLSCGGSKQKLSSCLSKIQNYFPSVEPGVCVCVCGGGGCLFFTSLLPGILPLSFVSSLDPPPPPPQLPAIALPPRPSAHSRFETSVVCHHEVRVSRFYL